MGLARRRVQNLRRRASYAVNGVPDIGADTMITKCKGVSTNFSNVEVGEALWCSGHIGVYIGGGLAVECSPPLKTMCRSRQLKTWGQRAGITPAHGRSMANFRTSNTTMPPPVQPDKPDTGAGAGGAIKAGSVVRVKQGAKTHTGGGLASFVYERDHVVSELNGDRAVITYGGGNRGRRARFRSCSCRWKRRGRHNQGRKRRARKAGREDLHRRRAGLFRV